SLNQLVTPNLSIIFPYTTPFRSLMTFLTSILLGLAMGSGTVFSIRFGQKDELGLKEGVLASFVLLGAVTIVLNILVFAGIDLIIWADRKSTRLNSSHVSISYAVFCLKYKRCSHNQ